MRSHFFTSFMSTAGLATVLALAVAAASPVTSTEILKGISDKQSGKSPCEVKIERDEKNEIVALKVSGPTLTYEHHQDGSSGPYSQISPSNDELADLANPRIFSEYRFQKQSDTQGDGIMMVGERVNASGNDYRAYLHLDIHESNIVGLQLELAQRAKNRIPHSKQIFEQICTSLKK